MLSRRIASTPPASELIDTAPAPDTAMPVLPIPTAIEAATEIALRLLRVISIFALAPEPMTSSR